MVVEQLLEKLEQLGKIDEKILAKIRRQAADQGKPIKTKAVLKYLVQKNLISQLDADQLLDGDDAAKPAEASPLPTATQSDSSATQSDSGDGDNSYGVDDLISGDWLASPSSTPAPPSTPKSDDEVGTQEPAQQIVKADPPLKDNSDRFSKKSSRKSVKKPRKSDKKPAKYDATKEMVASFAEDDEGQQGLTADDLRSLNRSTQRREHPVDDFASLDAAEIGPEPGRKLSVPKWKKNKSNQWATRWLYIGFSILGLLIIFGAVLAIFSLGKNAEESWRLANDSFKQLTYLDAAKKFEDYYTSFPRHKYVPLAKALQVQALIASEDQLKRYDQVILTADKLLPEIIDDPGGRMEDIRDDVAVLLPRALVNLTEMAIKETELERMEAELAKCLNLKLIVDNNAYIPTGQRNKISVADNLSKIDNNLRILQGEINKEKEYLAAIDKIQALGQELKTDEAFAFYRRLTRNYGDLAGRNRLQEVMLEISRQERNLVQPIEFISKISAQFRESPIERTYVLNRRDGDVIESLRDEAMSILVDGSVYVLRGSDGAILWRRFVGYQTDIQPTMVDNEYLLVSDLQDNDLMLIHQESGDLKWRTELGEPFLSPAFNESMIVVTTRSGKVLRINRDTGEIQKAVQLPQPANAPALVSDSVPFIYQIGQYSNIYILSNQDLDCREVFYLGHDRGSVVVPPLYWSGLILIAVNRGGYCDLWVFRPDENGMNLNLAQVMGRISDSSVSRPMQRYSRWALISGDGGDVRVLELQTAEEINPVTLFASDSFATSGARTYLLTEGSNFWIGGSELSRFKFQRTQGRFSREEIQNSGDSFLAPLQRFDEYLLHVRRRKDSGMLSASLVDGITLKPVWRCDFGGENPGHPLMVGNRLLMISNQGDLFSVIPQSEDIALSPVQIGSRIIQNLKFNHLISFGGDSLVAIGPSGQSELLFGDGEKIALARLSTPANSPATAPLVFKRHLIVASSEGPVVRINPVNGQLIGTPFMPPIEAGKKTVWYEPTLISESVMAIAHGPASGGSSSMYLLSLANEQAIQEESSIVAEQGFKSRLVFDGRSVIGVVAGESSDLLVAIEPKDQLSFDRQMGLPGRVTDGPWLIEQGVLLRMDNDQLLLIDNEFTENWRLKVSNDQFAGQPANLGSRLLLTFGNGNIWSVSPQSGELEAEFRLRQPLSSGPVQTGQGMFFNGRDGTLHEVDLSNPSGVN